MVVVSACSWLCFQRLLLMDSRDHMGCQGLNLGLLHARRVPYPLYYCPSPQIWFIRTVQVLCWGDSSNGCSMSSIPSTAWFLSNIVRNDPQVMSQKHCWMCLSKIPKQNKPHLEQREHMEKCLAITYINHLPSTSRHQNFRSLV